MTLSTDRSAKSQRYTFDDIIAELAERKMALKPAATKLTGSDNTKLSDLSADTADVAHEVDAHQTAHEPSKNVLMFRPIVGRKDRFKEPDRRKGVVDYPRSTLDEAQMLDVSSDSLRPDSADLGRRWHSDSEQSRDNDDDDDDDSDEWPPDDHIYENPMEIVAELEIREKTRRLVVLDLFKSEQQYVEKLEFVCKMRDRVENFNSVSLIFPAEEVDKMFPCFRQLRNLHRDHILPELRRTIGNWSQDSTISITFLAKMNDINMYSTFIKSWSRLKKTISSWMTQEPTFAKLLQLFEQNSECGQLPMLEVLMEPYKKLQQWRLILQRYHKYVESRNLDFTAIPEVCRAIEDILGQCESDMVDADVLNDLFDLEKRIDGLMVFMNADTVFVKDGPAVELDPRCMKLRLLALKRTAVPVHLFLFNSFLLICSPENPKKKHTVALKLQLTSIKLYNAVTPAAYSEDRCLVIQTHRKAYSLQFKTEEEASCWKTLLSKTCKANVCKNLKLTRQMSISGKNCSDFTCAPVWLPDDSSTFCMVCREDFTPIRWRHHCRGCGIIMCRDCSRRMKLPYDNNGVSRVCKVCYRRAQRFFPELLEENRRSAAKQLFAKNLLAKCSSSSSKAGNIDDTEPNHTIVITVASDDHISEETA